MEFQIDEDITLRLLRSQDACALFKLVDDNRLYLRRWLPWLDQNTSLEDSKDFIASVLSQFRADKGFACGIFFAGDLVGVCGYHEIDKVARSVAIGYWLSEALQGKGIITRCTKFFIGYAFEELGLTEVRISVAEGNAKSRAVCERLGLSNEGIEIDAACLYGRYVNHVCYAMSKDDWRREDGDAGKASNEMKPPGGPPSRKLP